MRYSRLVIAAGALIAFGVPVRAQMRQEKEAFTWSGTVPAGRWIRIRNLTGRIEVQATTGDKVEVRAIETWRRGNPDMVRFDRQNFGPGNQSVVICALWGDSSSCNENGYDHSSNNDRWQRNNDVSVEFRVLVPKGVLVGVSTVNGGVMVDGATAEVEASSVNGETDVNTSGGPVNAQSVNGRVRATMGSFDADREMRFESVNGSVTVEAPADLRGDVEMSTVNGGLHSDYEMTLSGRINPRRIRAHIGAPGGPRIILTTVNGSVELRKR